MQGDDSYRGGEELYYHNKYTVYDEWSMPLKICHLNKLMQQLFASAKMHVFTVCNITDMPNVCNINKCNFTLQA